MLHLRVIVACPDVQQACIAVVAVNPVCSGLPSLWFIIKVSISSKSGYARYPFYQRQTENLAGGSTISEQIADQARYTQLPTTVSIVQQIVPGRTDAGNF